MQAFQIAYEGDFWSLCMVTFWHKVDFQLVTQIRTRNYTVIKSFLYHLEFHVLGNTKQIKVDMLVFEKNSEYVCLSTYQGHP